MASLPQLYCLEAQSELCQCLWSSVLVNEAEGVGRESHTSHVT